MRFRFDPKKSASLRANPHRGIGFEEARSVFEGPHTVTPCSDIPEQYVAVGWVGDRMFSVVFEPRSDREGDYYWLVTLWRATKQEIERYEENE